jgi:hypothetical protein
MRAARVLLFATLGGATACSLALGGLEVAGGGDAGPGGDGSSLDGRPGNDAIGANDGDHPDAPGTDGAGVDADAGGGGGDASPDAPGDAALSPVCDDAGFLFCDGFEHGFMDGGWTTQTVGGGHVTIDSTHVHRGAWALHSSMDVIQNAEQQAAANVGHLDQGWPAHVYVRMFLYFPQPLSEDFPILLDFASYVMQPNGTQLNIQPTAGSAWAATWYDISNGTSDSWHSATVPTVGQWDCVELSVDSGNGDIQWWVDDVKVADLSRTMPVSSPALSHLHVGLGYYQPVPTFQAADLWIDDVAVDSQRVTCSR